MPPHNHVIIGTADIVLVLTSYQEQQTTLIYCHCINHRCILFSTLLYIYNHLSLPPPPKETTPSPTIEVPITTSVANNRNLCHQMNKIFCCCRCCHLRRCRPLLPTPNKDTPHEDTAHHARRRHGITRHATWQANLIQRTSSQATPKHDKLALRWQLTSCQPPQATEATIVTTKQRHTTRQHGISHHAKAHQAKPLQSTTS